MALEYGFYDSVNGDRKYNAEQMSRIFEGIINDGVYAAVGDKLFTTPGVGLQVIVGTGRAWFKNTWSRNNAAMPLDISQADPAFDRIDSVVLQVYAEDAVRENSIIIVKGNVAVNPEPPIFPTSEQRVYWLRLANVRVRAAATSISASDITITVGTSECPFVTSILQQTNIDTLFANWSQQFNDWWDTIKAVLDDNIATNLQNQIDTIETKLDGFVLISNRASADEALAGTSTTKWLSPASLSTVRDSYRSLRAGDIVFSTRDLTTVYGSTKFKRIPYDGLWGYELNSTIMGLAFFIGRSPDLHPIRKYYGLSYVNKMLQTTAISYPPGGVNRSILYKHVLVASLLLQSKTETNNHGAGTFTSYMIVPAFSMSTGYSRGSATSADIGPYICSLISYYGKFTGYEYFAGIGESNRITIYRINELTLQPTIVQQCATGAAFPSSFAVPFYVSSTLYAFPGPGMPLGINGIACVKYTMPALTTYTQGLLSATTYQSYVIIHDSKTTPYCAVFTSGTTAYLCRLACVSYRPSAKTTTDYAAVYSTDNGVTWTVGLITGGTNSNDCITAKTACGPFFIQGSAYFYMVGTHYDSTLSKYRTIIRRFNWTTRKYVSSYDTVVTPGTLNTLNLSDAFDFNYVLQVGSLLIPVTYNTIYSLWDPSKGAFDMSSNTFVTNPLETAILNAGGTYNTTTPNRRRYAITASGDYIWYISENNVIFLVNTSTWIAYDISEYCPADIFNLGATGDNDWYVDIVSGGAGEVSIIRMSSPVSTSANYYNVTLSSTDIDTKLKAGGNETAWISLKNN